MSAAEGTPDNEWLPDPRHCPSWCSKTHAEAYAEGNGWESSQVHICSGGGENLSGLTYAGRHVRDWGGGWDLTVEQRPLSERGGYWGPPLVKVSVSAGGRGCLLELTAGEALVLARQLTALVDRLET